MEYDAFNNLTGRSNAIWAAYWDSFTATYVNNRKTSGASTVYYDSAGNVVYSSSPGGESSSNRSYTDVKNWTFDAAGRMTYWDEHGPWGNETRGENVGYDGDGRVVKKNDAENSTTWHYVVSSVTGQKITDIVYDGTWGLTHIYMGSTLIAETGSEDYLLFKATDPVTGGTQDIDPDGTAPNNETSRNELAALDTSLPLTAPQSFPNPPHNGGFAGNAEFGCTAYVDGAFVWTGACTHSQLVTVTAVTRVYGHLRWNNESYGADAKIDAGEPYYMEKGGYVFPNDPQVFETLSFQFVDETPAQQVQTAIANARNLARRGECKTKLEELLRKAALQRAKEGLKTEGKDYNRLSKEEGAALSASIADLSVDGIIDAISSLEPVIKDEEIHQDGAGHDEAEVSWSKGSRTPTLTFYQGFFKTIRSGKWNPVGDDKPTTYSDGDTDSVHRAQTVIHEGFHAFDPTYSDGFLGRIASGKDRDLSREEGSKVLSAYIARYCK